MTNMPAPRWRSAERNTLPLEIYALISSATSPMLFAIGTLDHRRVVPADRPLRC